MFHPAGGPRFRLRPHCPNSPQVGQPLRSRGLSCTALSSRLVSPLAPPLIVTVDGPSGTGKSTVSKAVAKGAGLPHLDTGAFYRAVTLAVLRAGVDPTDGQSVSRIAAALDLGQEEGRMFLDGADVSEEIRQDDVTTAVSAVSAHSEVRAHLVEMQRSWVAEHGRRGVVEGRDIGSVVFPDATLKIFLDAAPEVRAARRAGETGENLEDVLADINRRDHFDSSRAASPLIVPDGAVVVDTSEFTFDQVVARLLALIRAKS